MVGRSILSNSYVSGLKEVGFVRSGLVQSMFDAIDVRSSVRLVNEEARDTANVVEVVIS